MTPNATATAPASSQAMGAPDLSTRITSTAAWPVRWKQSGVGPWVALRTMATDTRA